MQDLYLCREIDQHIYNVAKNFSSFDFFTYIFMSEENMKWKYKWLKQFMIERDDRKENLEKISNYETPNKGDL